MKAETPKGKKSSKAYWKRNYQMYLMLVPALVFVLIFKLSPMYGLTIAFKDYDIFAGATPLSSIAASKWVGFQYFKQIFSKADFRNAFANTLIISVMKIICIFPIPIILAIFINEVRSTKFQKGLQTIIYLPHFLSWAVVSGIAVSLLSSTGLINSVASSMGLDKINFLMNNHLFRWVLVFTDGWKEIGWNTIIYFAAIAGMDTQCFEAAEVDGANRFQRIWYIMLPELSSTIILMLILRVGSIMNAGFSQIFAMYNPTVYETADIIDTYIYRIGLGKMDFSLGTAVGVFNSVIALVLVLTSNAIARRSTGKSIW